MRLHRVCALRGELSSDLKLEFQSGARFGELLDVASDTVEAFLFGVVSYTRHVARKYRRIPAVCH